MRATSVGIEERGSGGSSASLGLGRPRTFLHALHEHAGWIAQSLPVVGSGGVCPSRSPQSERDGRSVHCEGRREGRGGGEVEVEVEEVVVEVVEAAGASG